MSQLAQISIVEVAHFYIVVNTTASTILNEMGYNHDAIERQLAHAESNKVRAAYNRAEYLHERVIIMNDWSNLIGSMTSGKNVVIGDFKRVG